MRHRDVAKAYMATIIVIVTWSGEVAWSGEIIDCAAKPGAGRWIYRVVEDRKCWFRARGLSRGQEKPLEELRWVREAPVTVAPDAMDAAGTGTDIPNRVPQVPAAVQPARGPLIHMLAVRVVQPPLLEPPAPPEAIPLPRPRPHPKPSIPLPMIAFGIAAAGMLAAVVFLIVNAVITSRRRARFV
jgi:hypothetical protein